MIEINNIEKIEKGSLLALCDVHIKPWKLTLKEVKIFQKGANRWIGMPSRDYLQADGSKKYIELMEWDNEGVKNSFKSQIIGAVDEFLARNPGLEPVAAVKEEELFPF